MDPIDDLTRSLRQEAREAAEELEADVREADLLGRTLSDAAFELGEDAAKVTIAVAGRTISGVVTHAGIDVIAVADPNGGTTWIRLDAIADIRIDDPGRGRTSPRTREPATFRAVLAGAQANATPLDLAGAELTSVRGAIVAVATDHLVLESGARRHVIPLSAIATASDRAATPGPARW